MRLFLKPQALAIFAGCFCVSFFSAILGPILPGLADDFSLPLSAGGFLFALWAAGSMFGAVVAGGYGHVLGFRKMVLISALALAVCAGGILLSPNAAILYWAMSIAGVFGGVLLTTIQGNIGLVGGSRAAVLNIFEVVFSAGTVAAPALIAVLQGFGGDWTWAYGAAIVVVAAPLGLGAVMPDAPITELTRSRKGGAYRALLADKFVMVSMAGIFFMVALEWSTSLWGASYLRQVHATDAKTASLAISIFWGGMMTSRIVLARLLIFVKARKILPYSVGLMAVSALILASGPGQALLIASFFLLGLGGGGVFPMILGMSMDRHPQAAPAVSGLILFTAGLASATIPAFLGWLADGIGLAGAIWMIPLLAALLAATVAVQRRLG